MKRMSRRAVLTASALLHENATNEEIAAVCTKLKLTPMAEVIVQMSEQMSENPGSQPTFRETAVMLINAMISARINNRISRQLRALEPDYPDACITQFYSTHKGLTPSAAGELCCCEWCRQHKNLLITGPTGSGKTWIADMLAVSAVLAGFRVWRSSFGDLITELEAVRREGSCVTRIQQLKNGYDLFCIDGFGFECPDRETAPLLQQMIEKLSASASASVMMTSSVDRDGWKEVFGPSLSGRAVMENIYSRMTGQGAISIRLTNSYSGNAEVPAAEGKLDKPDINAVSEDLTSTDSAFTSPEGKLDKPDINAVSGDFTSQNGPFREVPSAGSGLLPPKGSSLQTAVTSKKISVIGREHGVSHE